MNLFSINQIARKWLRGKRIGSTLTTKTQSIESEESLRRAILSIDREIMSATNDLFSSEKVKIASYLNTNRGFLTGLIRRRSFSAAKTSSQWHLRHLKDLLKARYRLQEALDKQTGNFWPKRLLLFGKLALAASLTSIIFCILIMGIMGLIYLIPALMIILIICIANKKIPI